MAEIVANQFDPTGEQAERGRTAEDIFKRSAEAEGWRVEESTPQQDMYDHIDFTIEWVGLPELHHKRIVGDGAKFTVDVKSGGTDKFVWLEIRNVHGHAGWLYGEADFIAFQREKGFLLVDRKKLQRWVEENVAKEYVTRKQDALMKVYTRQGRKDMITKVQNYHIIGLADGQIKNA
jgi:hypothetical protein